MLQVSLHVSRKYFDLIKAPVKNFIVFEDSAHFLNFEECGEFENIIENIKTATKIL